MKLSEAMREGAKHFPQGFNEFVQLELPHDHPEDGMQGTYHVCALGAAAYAYHPDIKALALYSDDTILRIIQKEGDVWIGSTAVQDPGNTNPGWTCSLKTAITLLNDDFKWSIEQIADWVEAQGY